MMISYEYYKIFYYACRYMNFTKAAEFLGTSQSSVSHIMQTLEHQLGCRLFSRSNRGIKLTPDGERLYSYVSAGCEQFIMGENELISGNTSSKGVVYLAATESALNCFLFQKLNDFNRLYPEIKLKIENLSSYAATDKVKDGSADYAVVTTPIKTEKPLKKKKLRNFSEVLICGERFKELSEREVKICEIADYPYVSLCSGTATRDFYDSFFEKNNLCIKPDTEVATTDMIIPMVKNNIGIGFVPNLMPSISDDGVYQVNLDIIPPERHISVVYNTVAPKSAAAKSFYRFICEGSEAEK